MCITERWKGLVHISLFHRELPSRPRRHRRGAQAGPCGPTEFEDRHCRRAATPTDGIMSLFSGRSNALASGYSDDLARQGWSTCRLMYSQQILDRHRVPVERVTTDYPILPTPGG